MRSVLRWPVYVILLALLLPPLRVQAQCPCEDDCTASVRPGPWCAFRLRMRAWFGRSRGDDSCGADLKVPPAPLRSCPDEIVGGMLLKTGALQLGPGVSRDLLRTQSDGYWGFWD